MVKAQGPNLLDERHLTELILLLIKERFVDLCVAEQPSIADHRSLFQFSSPIPVSFLPATTHNVVVIPLPQNINKTVPIAILPDIRHQLGAAGTFLGTGDSQFIPSLTWDTITLIRLTGLEFL